MLPKRLVRAAGHVVVAVAVCIAAVMADAMQPVMAQARLEAEYAASVAGIPIGRGNWVIEVSGNTFTAVGSATTTGILRFLAGVHGTSASRGILSDGQPVPTSYASTIHYGSRRIDDVRIALAAGNVTDYAVSPPLTPHPDRIPVTAADRRGVVDPLTSTLDLVGGSGDPVSPQACERKVAVFDGRLRYNLRSEFRRIAMVKAQKGYRGPAVVCAVYFTPVAGYAPGSAIIKYLVRERDAEVWLVPISGTHVLVPFRFTIPTPIGVGRIEATRFVSAAQSPLSDATAKVQ